MVVLEQVTHGDQENVGLLGATQESEWSSCKLGQFLWGLDLAGEEFKHAIC